MSTQIASYYEIVSQLPQDASLTLHDVSWAEYEELLEQVGEAPGLRITYDNGSLHAMTIYHLSEEGEGQQYVEGDASAALPMLSATLLTEMIERMRSDGELSALLAFDEWLQSRE